MSASVQRFALGQPVTFTASLSRERGYSSRTWKRAEHEARTGIVVGYRNRHDGKMEHDSDEWSGKSFSYYVAMRGFQTVLIATDLTRSPAVALPSDVAASPKAATQAGDV